MSFPKPEPGLVIRYSYLWAREHREGREEGVKDRPCAIVLALAAIGEDDDTRVIVLPVTYSQPPRETPALEIPPALKKHLHLDAERSWIVLSESNEFDWPGPDLRRVGEGGDSSIAYGILPPRFFDELLRRFLALEDDHKSRRVQRTE